MTAPDPDPDRTGPPDVTELPDRVRVDGGTAIAAAYGPTLTGTGDLHQVFNYGGGERRRRGPSSYDEHNEERLLSLFVDPGGVEQARSTLQRSRVVLLHGAPGCGRRHTALRLLAEQRTDDGGPIRTLGGRGDDPDERELLLEHVTAASRLLLDLSEVDDPSGLHLLAGLLNEVRERQAFVAVVLRRAPDRTLPDELFGSTSQIARPTGSTVFVRHLEQEGVDGPDPSGWAVHLHDYLSGSSMRDIRTLAMHTRDARDAEPAEDFTSWVDTALARATSRDTEIARSLGIPDDERHRTLAFAAAMFAGCPGDVVADAERRLIRAVGVSPGEVHELARPDLGTRLGRVGAHLAGDRVEFDAFHHASALRSYFWTQFPALRPQFHDWIIESAQRAGDHLQVEEYVGRYTDLAFRTGQWGLVCAAVEHWASRQRELAFAAAALSQGIDDAHLSRWFRARCYEWATSRTLASDLGRVVVFVCRTVIAESWPDQAVVRLYHLARHPDGAVREYARDGLAAVVGEDFALRRLLSRLVERLPNGEVEDLRLFLEVVEPDPDTSGRSRPPLPELTTCWEAVFRSLPDPEYERAVHRWLTVGARTDNASWLTGVLARAATAAGRGARLHTITHRWLAGPDVDPEDRRRTVARRLLAELETQRRAPDGTGPGTDGGTR